MSRVAATKKPSPLSQKAVQPQQPCDLLGDISPIFEPIAPTHRKYALFNLHRFFSKKDWNVIEKYISHFSLENDTVLDPFLGSGVSGLSALKCKRRFKGFDLLSWACFVAKETAVPLKPELIDKGLEMISRDCKSKIENLNKIQDRELLNILDTLDIPDLAVPVFLIRKSGPKTMKELFSSRQLISLAWLKKSINSLEDNALRNQFKLVLSAILPRVSKTYYGKLDHPTSGDSNIFKNANFTLAQGPLAIELPVWPAFEQRVNLLRRAKTEARSLFGEFYSTSNYIIKHGDALSLLRNVPSNSIDYIITDPPYDGRVQYVDLSTLWNAWLDFDDSSLAPLEVTVNIKRQITDDMYISRISEAIRQMGRVLKENRWLTLIYANSDLRYWKAVLDAAESSNLTYMNMILQPTGIRHFTKFKAPGSTTADTLMVNFQKKQIRHKPAKIIPLTNIEEYLKMEIERCIVECLGASTDEVVAYLANWILDSGDAKYDSIGNVMSLLRRNFFLERDGEDAGRWFHFPGDEIHDALPWIDRIRYSIFSMLRNGDSLSLETINAHIAETYASDTQRSKMPSLGIIIADIADKNRRGTFHLSRSLVRQYRLRLKNLLPDRVDSLLRNLAQKSQQSYILNEFKPIIEKRKRKHPLEVADFVAVTEALSRVIRALNEYRKEIEHVFVSGSLLEEAPSVDNYALVIVLKKGIKTKIRFIEKIVKKILIPVIEDQGVDVITHVKTFDEHHQELTSERLHNESLQSSLFFLT